MDGGGGDVDDRGVEQVHFALLVNYAAIETDVRRADPREQADTIYRTLVALPPEQFPLITAYAAQIVAGDGEERFRVSVDVVLDGMLARADRR